MKGLRNNEILHLGLVLFSITFATALLLGLVNLITKDKIAEAERLETYGAMKKIVENADDFVEIPFESDSKIVTGLFEARSKGEPAGYCVTVSSPGYAGVIDMIVGISRDSGKVLGVEIVSMSETPNLGTKTKSAAFMEQYMGGEGPFIVVTGATPAANRIEAVSGATKSSQAVTAGVNAALELVLSLA